MASISRQCEKADSGKSIRLTQSLDAVPTLHVVATFGQWYPEELECSSFLDAGDLTSNDSGLQISTEVSSRQNVTLSQRQHLTSSSAGKSDRKKRLTDCVHREDVRSRSHVKADQRQPKIDVSQAVWSSSKYSQVQQDNAVRFEISSNSQSVRVNTPRRVEGNDRRSSRRSHRMEACAAELVESAADARDEQSKTSDAWKSVGRGNATTASRSTVGTEVGFDTRTTGDDASLFQSAADARTAVEGATEHGGSEWMNFTVKIEPMLMWTDVPAAGSNERNDNIEESDVPASYDGTADREPMVESVVHGRTEGLKSSFDLSATDCNTSENILLNKSNSVLCNENKMGNIIPVGNEFNTLVSKYDSNSFKDEHVGRTLSSSLSTSSKHLQIEVGNSMKETCHCDETKFSHTNRSPLNKISMPDVSNFKSRRCFSCDNISMAADAARSSSRGLSASADASAVCTCCWSKSPPSGRGERDGRAMKRASPPGDVDYLQLPARTCSHDARLTDASHLLPASTDRHSDSGRQTPPIALTDGLDWQAGARCCAAAHLQFNSVVLAGSARAADAESAGGMSWPRLDQSAAEADQSALPAAPRRIHADRPTSAAGRRPAASVDSASYCAERQSCAGADVVMGLTESAEDMQNSVESVDITSTLSVNIGGGGDADVDASTNRLPVGARGVGWNSLLNPAAAEQLGGDAACGVGPTAATTAADGLADDDEVDDGGHVIPDMHCWSPPPPTLSPGLDLRQLKSAERVNEAQPALDGGARRPVDTREGDTSGCERDVDNCRDRVALYTDNDKGVDYTGDDDDDGASPRQSGVVDEALRCCGELNRWTSGPQWAVNGGQENVRVSSQQSRPHADDRLPARDGCPPAAVRTGVGDAELTLDTEQRQNLPPPPSTTTAAAVGHASTKTDRHPTPADSSLRVSDDDHIESCAAETDAGGATMASDDSAGPPPRTDEPTSNDHVPGDAAAVKLGRDVAADDDEVDRKLADELERLKGLVVSSPRTSTTVSRHDNFVSSVGAEETFTEDVNGDNDDSELLSNNNGHTLRLSCTSEVREDTEESESVCADLETACTVEPQLPCTDDKPNETDSPAADKDLSLRSEAADDDGDNVVSSMHFSADSLPPAAAVVERLQEMYKVSSRDRNNAGGSKHSCLDSSIYFMLADDIHASTVQQTLSQANSLSSTDTVGVVLNSAANNALVDVIDEAERSLFSSCSDVNTSSQCDKTFSQGTC